LQSANLWGADLRGADLRGAYLSGANLWGADLQSANLWGANLRGADLQSANLWGANLQGADLQCAYLSGAKINGKTAICILRRTTRSDGYEFFLWHCQEGFFIKAGCRFFTWDEARDHWTKTRVDTPLGNETLDILAFFGAAIVRQEAAK
jgi:hypothetical protein